MSDPPVVPEAILDFTGKRRCNWDVLSYAGKRSGRHVWNCRCTCSLKTEMIVAHVALMTEIIRSCGKSANCRKAGDPGSLKKQQARQKRYLDNRAAQKRQRYLKLELKERKEGRPTNTFQGRHKSPAGLTYGIGFVDRTGDTHGALRVLRYTAYQSHNQQRWWMCRCRCGKQLEVREVLLVLGAAQDCGCGLADKLPVDEQMTKWNLPNVGMSKQDADDAAPEPPKAAKEQQEE